MIDVGFSDNPLKRLIQVRGERKKLQALVDTLYKQELELSRDVALNHMIESGVDSLSLNVNGERWTLYTATQAAVRPAGAGEKVTDEDRDRVIRALHVAGLDDLVKEQYNANTLGAYVRECEREERELPAPLAEALEVKHWSEVRVRRAPAKKEATTP